MNKDIGGTCIHSDTPASSPDWAASAVLLCSSQIESRYIAMHPVVGNFHPLQVSVVIRVHTRRISHSLSGMIAVVVIEPSTGRIHVNVHPLIFEDGVVVAVDIGTIKGCDSIEHAVPNDVVRNLSIRSEGDYSSSVGIFDLAVE